MPNRPEVEAFYGEMRLKCILFNTNEELEQYPGKTAEQKKALLTNWVACFKPIVSKYKQEHSCQRDFSNFPPIDGEVWGE